jgi:MoxR-like ATPase
MTSAYDKMQGVRTDMNRVLLERQGPIDNAMLALLTRQHYLQVSREPGTAKTMLANALTARIVGAKYFEVCFNPGTTADELLGPVDLLAYADQGKRQRVMARSLAEADIAFLDEIGRGNDLVYPVLLPLMGDKRTVNELGLDAPLTIPLVSLFAASNTHLSGQQRLEALNNRFLLRDEILPIQERASLIALATNPPKLSDVQATMTLDDLRQAQGEAQMVRGDNEVLDAALTLKEQLLGEGVAVTGRMWAWSFPLLKAHAWLHGGDTLTLEDLSALASAWWEDPKDRQLVQRAIYSVAKPLEMRAIETEDAAMALLDGVPDEDDPDFAKIAKTVNVQFRDMLTMLGGLISQSKARDKRRALQSFQRVGQAQKRLAETYARQDGLGEVDLGAILNVG